MENKEEIKKIENESKVNADETADIISNSKKGNKKGKKARTFTLIAILLCVSIVILGFLQRLVMPKYSRGIVEGAFLAEYYEETTKHEVIFVGDCEVYENFSPIEMYEKYGITSYIRGGPQQLIWHSYYQLEDTLKYETPKVVVFNVLSLKYNEPKSESYNRMNIDGMKWSKTKYDLIKASMLEEESMIEYMLPLLRYHSRITNLKSEDWTYLFKNPNVSHNGYYMRVDVKPATEFPEPNPLTTPDFGENAMKYLDKMTKLCKDNGIELILIKAPIKYPHWYEEWDNNMVNYAKENNLTYINMIDLIDEIGIDFNTDTYDAGLHLNLAGATKLSDYFGQYLVDNYDLTDYREDPEYKEVYAEKIKFYNEIKEQQYDELEKYGKLVNFGSEAIEN